MTKTALFSLSLALAAATAALLAVATPTSGASADDAAAKSVLDFTVADIDGKPVPLSRYKGDVLLIVNTASLCGNTPQYASLETLYQRHKAAGLRILAFPSNDFGQQEPGSNGEIKAFCSTRYKTTFDLFEKVDVKGKKQAPLYAFLTGKQTDPKFAGDIEWNFAKFLVGRDGTILNRFPAGTDPLTPNVTEAVEAALKK